jgi:adenine-specific DNA-methyltransferase
MDSFLGSGTTAAVALKMNRQFIGIEMGTQCYVHCKCRLDKVIDGEQGGVSKSVDWQGGGGFRFFELGESLIQKDKWGQEIINKNFNAEMLAQALCKIEGFIYAPSKEEFFIHGHSTENDFIYVTTNFMTAEYLKSISEQLGEKRSLLICCKGFESSAEFSNLTVKKIPKAVLDKCEWGHDDYSLNVVNLPMSASVPVQAELFDDIEGDEK